MFCGAFLGLMLQHEPQSYIKSGSSLVAMFVVKLVSYYREKQHEQLVFGLPLD